MARHIDERCKSELRLRTFSSLILSISRASTEGENCILSSFTAWTNYRQPLFTPTIQYSSRNIFFVKTTQWLMQPSLFCENGVSPFPCRGQPDHLACRPRFHSAAVSCQQHRGKETKDRAPQGPHSWLVNATFCRWMFAVLIGRLR